MLDIGQSPVMRPAIDPIPDMAMAARRRIEKAGRALILEIRSLHGKPSAASAQVSAEEAIRLAVIASAE